jgi:Flp pilus assembly protein TadG
VAVETALVSLVLLTIMYGVVETSFLYRDALVVSSASRAGARVASSLPRDASFASAGVGQVADALGNSMDLSRVTAVWVFKANPATGLPDSGSFASCTSCVKYLGTSGGLVVDGAAGWSATAQDACAGTQDTLGVYVQYRYPSRLGWFFTNQRLQESTVMRLEPYTGAGTCRP